jgi:hypothetical protein
MSKKLLITLFLLSITTLSNAQHLAPYQVKLILNGTDSLIKKYAKLGTLIEDAQLKVAQDPTKNRYFELFKDSLVNVYGDLLTEHNIEAIKDGKKPKLLPMALKDYVIRNSMKFRYGMKVKIINVDPDLNGFKNNQLKVMVEQDITGIKSKGKEVENQDTVVFVIEFNPSYTVAKIASITATGLGGHMTITNADMDEIEAKKKALKPVHKK